MVALIGSYKVIRGKIMELLRDNDDFLNWKEANTCDGDEAEPPKEYPCLVLLRVKDWNMQYEVAEYYFKDDIKGYLDDLTL